MPPRLTLDAPTPLQVLSTTLATSPAGVLCLPLTFSPGADITVHRRLLSAREDISFSATSSWLHGTFSLQKGSSHGQLCREGGRGGLPRPPQFGAQALRVGRRLLKAGQLLPQPALARSWARVRELLIEFTLVKNVNKLQMTS